MNADPSHSDLSTERLAALRAEAHEWASALAAGQPTTDDVDAFLRWRLQSPAHVQAWAHASRTWRKMGEVAQVFEARHAGQLAVAPRSRSRPQEAGRRMFFGAAASAFGVLLVAGLVRPPLQLWPSWSELGADYRTATGEQRNIELGDRIRVALNTQTSVSVQQDGEHPNIELISGEAAVSARHAPCDVMADDGRIRVIEGEIEVRRLASGQVRVRCNQGMAELRHPLRTVALAAQQQLVYDRHELGVPMRLPQVAADWQQGMVAFHDLPLRDAIEEINRYRPGRLVLVNDALANRRFSANVEISALDDVVDQLETVHRIKVRRVGEFVFLG